MEHHILLLYIVVTFTLITSIFFYINRDTDNVTVYRHKFTTSSTKQQRIYEFAIKRDSSAVIQINIFGYNADFTESVHVIQSRSHYNNDGKITTSNAYSELEGAGGVEPPSIVVNSTGNLVEVLLTPSDETETIWNVIITKTV